MLTPRENFLRYLRGELCLWQPTSGDMRRFAPAFVRDHVARGFVWQQQPFPKENYGGPDMLGIEWIFQPAVGGSIEARHPIGDLDDLALWREKLRFPRLAEMDWARCARENAAYLDCDKLLQTTIYSGFFERLVSLVGFENAAIALIDESCTDEVAALFDALADYYIELIVYYHRYFNIEYFELHDDWGSQSGTLFSEETHRALILPAVRKVAAGAHAEGVFIEQHSCGRIERFVPLMIESGVDTWMGQALNDKRNLVERYGAQFKFGVSLQAAPPYDEDMILRLARDSKREYAGKNVWFVLPYTLPPAQKERLGALMREI